MIIMVHTNTGKERTLKEWEYVLNEAGFRRFTLRPIDALPSIIEAFPLSVGQVLGVENLILGFKVSV